MLQPASCSIALPGPRPWLKKPCRGSRSHAYAGDGFSYRESFGAKNIAIAGLLTTVYALGFAALQFGFMRNFIKARSAGGPSKSTMENGYWCACPSISG